MCSITSTLCPSVCTSLDTVTAFAQWTSPPGVLAPVFDYPDRG
jgi:hypothetical protein